MVRLTQRYSGAKNPTEGEEIYKKTYYTVTDNNGNKVTRYRIDRNGTYEDVQSPNSVEYDRQYIRNGGKIVADSNGNVIYKDSTKTQYDIDHPIKSAMKRAFITGDSGKNTRFYDSNGNLDESRSSHDYRGINVGKLPDVMPDSSNASNSDSYSAANRFPDYTDTLWSAAV